MIWFNEYNNHWNSSSQDRVIICECEYKMCCTFGTCNLHLLSQSIITILCNRFTMYIQFWVNARMFTTKFSRLSYFFSSVQIIYWLLYCHLKWLKSTARFFLSRSLRGSRSDYIITRRVARGKHCKGKVRTRHFPQRKTRKENHDCLEKNKAVVI